MHGKPLKLAGGTSPVSPHAVRPPRFTSVSRSTVNFCIDLALGALFVLLLTLSGIVSIVFPNEPSAGEWTLVGYTLDSWRLARDAVLVLFTLAILIHLIMHWSWVCGYVSARRARRRGSPIKLSEGEKTLYGVTILVLVILLVSGGIAAAEFAIRAPAALQDPPRSHVRD